MTDEPFKQSRRKITTEELGNEASPFEGVRNVQQAMARETGNESANPVISKENAPFQISGNMPPEFKEALQRKAFAAQTVANAHATSSDPTDEDGFQTFEAPPDVPRAAKAPKARATPDSMVNKVQGSDNFTRLIGILTDSHEWEEHEFPSRGKFYSGIPSKIHVRPMTGEEEQILATPRWVKKGKAIDMIFRRCIKEPIATEELLSVDRTHLLIYLRGISYTPEYDVEIKCPNCSTKFAHVIELDDLDVNLCPEEFGQDSLSGVLPVTKFKYSYRLATGSDEQEISTYREKRIAEWGDQGEDDTLLYRTALLLDDIEGVTMKKELAHLLKKLPIQDVAHLRNEINTPPFGVNTMIELLCPSCSEEFKIDLPLETNFFFPRKREERTPA